MLLQFIYDRILAESITPIEILTRTANFLRSKNQKDNNELSAYEGDKHKRLQKAFDELIENTSWEDIYEGECFDFKSSLKIQADVLRNDSSRQGIERVKRVCKVLLELSKQIALIGQVAVSMVEETPDCELVCKLPREWLFSQTGESEVEQVCVIMEYTLDRLAFELKADPSLDVNVAEHLEQMIKDINADFLP